MVRNCSCYCNYKCAVQPQSSGSFTVRYFTTIQIVTTGTATSQGQLCLTVRYPIS
ncbi:hypothetical protein CN285_23785 [Bacillus cereus]|nr:hypothetical protein CN285_23785 [Bacillus cereus]PGM58599.1 hypothetical protein CN947_21655 [Bacillus cereus]